jgi:hypothetical protein
MLGRHKKCCLCGKRDPNVVECIEKVYIYSSDRYWYHQYCLDEISANPTQYTDEQVDLCIEIHDKVNDFAKKIEQRKERFFKNCDKLIKISKILNGEMN